MPHSKKTKGLSIQGCWNDLSTLERVKMILEHPDHFLNLGLITREELSKVMACSETEWEYLIDRDPSILFHDIDIDHTVSTQTYREKLKTALNAVFFEDK